MFSFKLLINMKNIFLILYCFVIISCKKNDDLGLNSHNATQLGNSINGQSQLTAATQVSVIDHGAKGDGVTDDTQAIENTMNYAKINGFSSVYFPQGIYLIKQLGIASGVIPLLNGISLTGAGANLTRLILSGGRHNPNAMFYQAWWNEPSVSNVIIQGIDFNGNLANQTFDSSYEYCHALSINNGSNIQVYNCKFESFRGDGCLFGDTFESTLNQRIVTNVSVHNSEFYNIYREGAMFCCVKTGSFYQNYIHGNGYYVAGVDIERHSANETVLNVDIYNNKFDFTDGYGPVERGGPIVKYRRAVSMGFFYAGYINNKADGLSGGHKIYNNQIYQGQVDCWGHTNVSISNNTFKSTYENIAGVGWLSTPAINISDPAKTTGLVNVSVKNNSINSTMAGNGILFDNYTSVSAIADSISQTGFDGINIYNASGIFDSNVITNVGTMSTHASGIVINGNCSGTAILNNIVQDLRSGGNRTVNYAVFVGNIAVGSIAPSLTNNRDINLISGVTNQ